MKKAKDAIKRQLKEQWQQSCNGFLVELLRMWELDAHYGYWIGDETGGVYDYGDGIANADTQHDGIANPAER